MAFKNSDLIALLDEIDFGSSVAELDTLLESARVETSVFHDIFSDRVDLIPGTKGSGKSALFRIFVEFLPQYLLNHKKAVIAHGVQKQGDSVFHAFNDQFAELSEDEFVDFWCIYLVSLVHEQFIKEERFSSFFHNCKKEIDKFKQACASARIPEIKTKKSLMEILEWALNGLSRIRPKLKYILPDNQGEFELEFSTENKNLRKADQNEGLPRLPIYISNIKDSLDEILNKIDLSIWLMIDKLDEIFPRRSGLERKALKGLLRTTRIFFSERIRVKVFLRDDMLDEVVRGSNGFTALTHVTARQADTLRWKEEQILTMIIKRLFNSERLGNLLEIDMDKLNANSAYREQAFYKVFPNKVHKGEKHSKTLRWLYNHARDGNDVVTPRDIIELLQKAKQHQYDLLSQNPDGNSDSIIGSQAILYGYDELSEHKRITYLKAEFPHLWEHISKFNEGKAEYTEKAIKRILGAKWKDISGNLIVIGFLKRLKRKDIFIYSIPFLYRRGLKITQGLQQN